MKKIAIFLSVVFLFSACSTTKDMSSSRTETRKLRKLAEQAEIKKAVESRRYVIKVNRIFVNGAMIEMIPSANFVILNGEIASVSLGYLGRSFGIHQITGINMNGRTTSYKMESNSDKGLYKIQMAVTYGADKFDMYITIGNNGDCNISLNNPYIQTVSYSGNLYPLAEPNMAPTDKHRRI